MQRDINQLFESILCEGVYDKGIFKVVFLQGPPGSGKDYVLDKAISGHGLIEINSDKALEYLMDKDGLDKKMPKSEKAKRDFIRLKAKNTTDAQQRLAIDGRNGLIINGTGDTLEKIQNIKDILDKRGYQSMMLSVNVSNEVSKQRNIERGERGGRTIPEEIRLEKFNNIQKSKPKLKKLFGDDFIEFDNSIDLRYANPRIVAEKNNELLQIHKKIRNFVNAEISDEKAKHWIASELHKKDTSTHLKKITSDKKINTLGLDYYGFGRYGKSHKVTHREINGQLIPVQHKIKEENEMEYVKNHDGKIKKYKVRRFAAKDAHHKNGEVEYDGKKYKVKFRKNVNEDIDLMFESIDFNIEPGTPMNGFSKEKLNKKGKVTMAELTGDETTDSISAQKEGELKRKGISLSTFKARNSI